MPSVDAPGLSLDPRHLHQGGNSGYQAINLAVLMGAERILLLGFDMKLGAAGRVHWHGDHPETMRQPSGSTFRNWRQKFAAAAIDAEQAGIEVVNCTPGSALECFPMATITEALNCPTRAR